jgi:hypothetical protein
MKFRSLLRLLLILIMSAFACRLQAAHDYTYGALWEFEHDGKQHFALRLVPIVNDRVENNRVQLFRWWELDGKSVEVSPNGTDENIPLVKALLGVPGLSAESEDIDTAASPNLYDMARYIRSKLDGLDNSGKVAETELYIRRVNSNGKCYKDALDLFAGFPLSAVPGHDGADIAHCSRIIGAAKSSSLELKIDPALVAMWSTFSVSLASYVSKIEEGKRTEAHQTVLQSKEIKNMAARIDSLRLAMPMSYLGVNLNTISIAVCFTLLLVFMLWVQKVRSHSILKLKILEDDVLRARSHRSELSYARPVTYKPKLDDNDDHLASDLQTLEERVDELRKIVRDIPERVSSGLVSEEEHQELTLELAELSKKHKGLERTFETRTQGDDNLRAIQKRKAALGSKVAKDTMSSQQQARMQEFKQKAPEFGRRAEKMAEWYKALTRKIDLGFEATRNADLLSYCSDRSVYYTKHARNLSEKIITIELSFDKSKDGVSLFDRCFQEASQILEDLELKFSTGDEVIELTRLLFKSLDQNTERACRELGELSGFFTEVGVEWLIPKVGNLCNEKTEIAVDYTTGSGKTSAIAELLTPGYIIRHDGKILDEKHARVCLYR